MGTLKTLVFLNAYQDSLSSGSCSGGNNPNKQNFKWTRETTNIGVDSALSETFQVPPGASQSLFSGMRTLTQDGTTQYSIALVPLNTSIYQLTNTGGTAPTFRTLRVIGTDATSQVTTSLNGTVLTFTFTGGTLPTLTSVIPGDQVLIGNDFNVLNQGIFTIISTTTTSVSVVNGGGIIEGPITLGSGFANQLRIFSGTGVQIGDTLVISSGFSPVTWNSYQVTLVTDYYVQFSYAGILPTESGILTEVAIYSMAKTTIYMEADQPCELLLNGAMSGPILTPLVSNGKVYPGLFLLNSTIYSLSVVNTSINPANLTLLSTE